MNSAQKSQQTGSDLPQRPECYGDFCYRPLDHADGEDIRLLSLYPGSFHDPIRCDIFHASLQFEVEYEAVSYTWATEDGDTSLSKQIACAYVGETETTDLMVTVNCASALRRLRDESHERTLWIDAICIDQRNRSERSHQVELMAEIYSNALQVLAYLGEEDLGFGSRSLWTDSARRVLALKKLFAKRWVSRVWVIQEVALAQKVVMITGNVACHLDSELLCRIRGRARAHGLHTPGPLAWDPIVNASTRDLLSMLHISRNCFSSDPRDKVYGLLGLTGERLQSLIKVDYSQSVEEVLTRAAAAIITCREDLDILAYAALSSLGTRHMEGRLPTWVPDWTEHREDTTVRPQFQSAEMGPWRSLAKLSGLRRTYMTKWDEVVYIPSVWNITSSSRSYLTVRAHCIGTIDGISRQVDSLSEGQLSSWPSPHMFSHQLAMLLDRKIDPPFWPPEFRWLLASSKAQEASFQGESEKRLSAPDILSSFARTDLTSFCTELNRLGKNKKLFRAGYLPAIASACFQEGDTVWAVDGCTVPLILRTLEDRKYAILGDCYLLGLRQLDCWAETGTANSKEWHFDPFRQMDARGTQTIKIY
ncbi:heterokaryon incompatibility protein-domain-containing protein [Pyrenochaeta sp. MPI-SDFR-AT-0127]|nr:heterokaryon incompatibility protein-domain-containing protein [Pyrenochaeta sp. MPI-SDFR-AT-0127]